MRTKIATFTMPNGDVVKREVRDSTFHATSVKGHNSPDGFHSKCSTCGWKSDNVETPVLAMDLGHLHTVD